MTLLTAFINISRAIDRGAMWDVLLWAGVPGLVMKAQLVMWSELAFYLQVRDWGGML